MRPAEISRHRLIEIFSDQAGHRSVGIDDQQRPGAQRQVARERSDEAHAVGNVAAVDQLRAGDALDRALAEYERIGALLGLAPEGDASVAGMIKQQLALE